MNLQYISDNKGITTGVFIPIQEWRNLKECYNLPEEDHDLSPAQKKELDYRIDQHIKSPDELLDWDVVKERLLLRRI